MIFQSADMYRVIEQAKRFARSSATVLITGESGTGKELVARIIHDLSRRSQKRYVRVNCAALSESLMESELFGHERGAFTGATCSRVGRFEWADGGSLLLDEISEVPIGIQAKLLRVLEEGELQRVGHNKNHQVDVRVIATSNRDLAKEARDGRFRCDLYHRLNVLQIEMPPLRERKEDITVLSNYFVDRFRHETTVRVRGFSKPAMEAMAKYDWPGNVRQLRNVVHRACIVTRASMIQVQDMPEIENQHADFQEDSFWNMRLDDIERVAIIRSLQRFRGNKTAAAAHLGITSRTILNKIKKYVKDGHAVESEDG